MIKRASEFIVNMRKAVLAVMLVLAAVCAVAQQFVEINEDMTKYLPDDSNMKAGIDLMDGEFPELESSNTIRVMFDGLDDAQKRAVLRELGDIPNVDDVEYEAGSADYDKDGHTLYVLDMDCDYGSAEESAIESELESRFADYDVTWKDDDTGFPPIPTALIVTALAILLAVLFVMCGSWIEPFLFLVVIGVAVVINAGTNLVLGSVANITSSIAAILQLVLSMDYSIILMNRYRQEKELEPDSVQAMKNALARAFPSVASSSLTTVVGLLMLVLMSFKIGANLGIVLAKGVFISMVCVLTMLPGIILACDKLIRKTGKRSLGIPTDWAARYSYKMRYPLVGAFAVLFIAAFVLQQQTGIVYTLAEDDEIAEVFPKDNTVVLVYENADEDKVAKLAAELETDENVKSVMGYSTSLGKPYTARELARKLADMDDGISLDSNVLGMLYYDFFNEGKTGAMTAADFLAFVSDTALNDRAFAPYIDEAMRESAEELGKFADPAALTSPKTAEELAGFFDIDPDAVKSMLIYYHASLGDYDPGTMTLPAFVDFLQNGIVGNPAFSSYLDDETREQVATLATFTDAGAMRAPKTANEMASFLGVDESLAQTVFVLHNAQDVSGKTMGLAQFASFLNGGLLDDPVFGSSFDSTTRKKLKSMDELIQLATSGRELKADQMAQVLGMDAATVERLYLLYVAPSAAAQGVAAQAAADAVPAQRDAEGATGNAGAAGAAGAGRAGDSPTTRAAEAAALPDASGLAVSLPDFTAFLASDVLGNDAYAAAFTEEQKTQLVAMNKLVQVAASGTGLDAPTLAQTLGMDADQAKLVFRLYFGSDIAGKTMSVEQGVDFILSDPALASRLDGAQLGQLQQAQRIIKASLNGAAFSYGELADFLGMDASQLKVLYTVKAAEREGGSWRLSVQGFIDFILDDVLANPSLASQVDTGMSDSLASARTLVGAVVSGNTYSAEDMTALLGGLTEDLDATMVELLYLYAESLTRSDSSWTMTLEGLVGFLANDVLADDRFASVIDDDMRQEVPEMQDALSEARDLLVADRYSRLVITTVYPGEAAETTGFIGNLERFGSDELGEFHLVGNSVMNYEMQSTFGDELLFITLLTALAIFAIVALTFKSLSIPLILVLLVQCGVYITVAITGALSGSMYYLALLIVECILLGATVDYGILLTNYYCAARKTADVRDALKAAYAGSIHTIMSSGLILILVTAAVGGMFENPTIEAIVKTISLGALCVTVLILFVLPGLLAVFDRFVAKDAPRSQPGQPAPAAADQAGGEGLADRGERHA